MTAKHIVLAAGVIGASVSAFSAAISIAESVGGTPAFLFLQNRTWTSTLRVGTLPVEFLGAIWFAAVLCLYGSRARRARMLAPAVFMSAAAVVGFGAWFLMTRSASCVPFYIATASAAAILATVIADERAWPASFRADLRADLAAFRSSSWAHASVVGFLAISALAGSALHVVAAGYTREQAFERDLRRWYLHKSATAAALLPARDGEVVVVEFTDYSSLAPRNVAPQRAAQVDEFRRHGLPVRLITRQFPRDPECNAGQPAPVRSGACEAAYAVKLAALVGGDTAARNLSVWLYGRSTALSRELVLDRLGELGWRDAFEQRRADLRKAIDEDVRLARSVGVVSAPAYFINGVRMPEGKGMLTRLLRIEHERRGLSGAPAVEAPASGGITASRTGGSISMDGAPVLGSETARVVLIEFSDFQCAFCAAFARNTLPALKKKYVESGRLRFVYMHLPLPPIHADALGAAEAAECANRQGRFWPLHDLFFARQNEISARTIRELMVSAGATGPAVDHCMAGGARAAVADQTARAFELDIRGTPAFFLGYAEGGSVRIVTRLQGARPLADFERAIDSILAVEPN